MAKQHYVDNPRLLQACKDYKKELADAEQAGEPKPQMPEYIAECILNIAKNLAKRPNFANYTYKDDMISDGVEDCILRFHNIDPEKYSNPFGYFTRIIWFAFLRRIKDEKHETLIKAKLLVEMPFDLFDLQAHDEDGTTVQSYKDFMSSATSIYNDALQKEEDKKKAKINKKANLESLIEPDVLEV